MTVIKERRFKLELYTTNKDFTENKEFICELQSCQLTFQLSCIPKAVIKPLFGTVVNKEDSKTATSFENFIGLAQGHTPVKIVLFITQNFSSEGDNALSEWEVELSKTADKFGQYTSEPITIFEGYLTPPTAEVFSTKVSMTLVVQHWLSSLANISMLTTACHTSTPAELSLQCYNIKALVNSSEKSKWLTINKKEIELYKDPGGLWKNGIKKLFEAVLDAEAYKTYNAFIDEQKERIRIALNKIEGSALTLRTSFDKEKNNTTEKGVELLCNLISIYLNSESLHPYFKQSAWDRLMYFSNCFLFSLVPRVSDAKLIPLPCLIDPLKTTALDNENIFQISSSPLSSVQLSRLVCVSSTATNTTSGNRGSAAHVINTSYPNPTEGYYRDGYIKSIAYPEWLIRGFPYRVVEVERNPMVFSTDFKERIDDEKKQQEEFKKAQASVMNTIGRGFAKASYITQALNTTWATIVTPVRMDICPGSAISCYIASDTLKNESETTLDLYGIVTGVVVNLASGTSPSTTQITMSQIRAGDAVFDTILNPYLEDPCTTGFYTTPWYGNGVKLYD